MEKGPTLLPAALLAFLILLVVPMDAFKPKLSSISARIPRGGSSYHDSSHPLDELFPQDQESVQDRVNAWKQSQMRTYGQLTEDEAANPRDEQGRVKLLTSVGKGSRALIFFILMWRDVHLFETADQALKGITRLFVVTTLILLFFANLAGVVASFTSPSHSTKKRLKAILNLDKLIEGMMIFFNFGRLTVFPSKYTPREIYIANTLHSVFFILQSQAFTRLTWDEFSEVKVAGNDVNSRFSQVDPNESYPVSTDPYQEEQIYFERNGQHQQHSGYGTGSGDRPYF